MAISTATAIGLGVAGLGSALGASSSRKAASKAADTSMQVANQNNALARENRDMLMTRADPFVNSGQRANALLDGMLGTAAPQTAPTASNAQYGAPMPMGGGMASGGAYSGGEQPYMMGGGMDRGMAMYGRTQARPMMPQRAPQGQAMAPMGQPAPNGQDAFRNYIANSDYAFQFGEGSNALNSGYAGAGTLQSGAAMRDLEQYRQNLQSGYRNEYMDRLTGQQGVGLSALGAAAGVGTNFVNQVSQNNNNAGSAAANAQLIRGNNNPFANAMGMIGGGILGRG